MSAPKRAFSGVLSLIIVGIATIIRNAHLEGNNRHPNSIPPHTYLSHQGFVD